MKIRLADDIVYDSIVDGPGVRAVIFTQGCIHNCVGCHNPNTHSFKGGIMYDTNDINFKLSLLEGQDGITISGGEPFLQVDACLEIAMFAKERNINIWCYTGFTFEQLISLGKLDEKYLLLLRCIDVLVDSKFKLEEKSYDLLYKGSRNQRIIDVRASIENEKVIELDQYNNNIELHLYNKPDYMFM